MQNKGIFKGYLFIVISAVIYGCMPLMAKYIYADGVNAMSLVLLRNALSLPFLFLLGLLGKQSFGVSPKKIPPVMIIGIIGCAVAPFLLFSSYRYMNSGTATVFHFVYPAIVLLLEWILLKGRIKGGSLVAILLCVTGIALFYNPGEPLSPTGSVLALTSGLAFAVYVVLLGKHGRGGMGVYVFSFFAAAGATALLLVICLAGGMLALPRSLFGWVLSVIFALLVNVGAVVLFQSGTFLIGGQKASILSTFEPITSLVVGMIIFDETVTWLSVVGTILVLAASVVIAVQDGREQKKSETRTAKEGKGE